MRLSLSLVIIGALVSAPVVSAQTAAATRPAVTEPAVTNPASTQPAAISPPATPAGERGKTHASGRAHSRKAAPRRTTDTAAPRAPAGGSDGVLALGASDITGNKELPKVMVIVPWKDSLGAGGVVKPTDSLLDEVLTPVDRSVFQRRIRYYGQLNTEVEQPAGGNSENRVRKQSGTPHGAVAPAGDSR
ncbi:MAG TPA: hypothetical protein VGT07_06375 [Steroidobacteraceae bacterium]|nr:hypothetical protein [Steroidobacteraceae bacterium]